MIPSMAEKEKEGLCAGEALQRGHLPDILDSRSRVPLGGASPLQHSDGHGLGLRAQRTSVAGAPWSVVPELGCARAACKT